MKKLILALLLILLLIGGLALWLAGSVGPETAPTETQTITLPQDYDL